MIKVEDIEPGIQRMVLNAIELYPNYEDRRRFEARLSEFLEVDTSSEILDYKDGVLSYLTESVIPNKRDFRQPLLLLFGNPAPASVRHRCFFATEKGRREHRFWLILEKAGIISFNNTDEDINTFRSKALFDLDYESPFRVGLAVFYSMPSPASGPKWSGVAGLRKLFGARALRTIACFEKRRVENLAIRFITDNSNGAIIAFQKDAYLGIKDAESPETTILAEKQWHAVESRCSCANMRLFRLPATRYMMAQWYGTLMLKVSELCLREDTDL